MPKAVIYNMAGQQVGEIELSDAIFGVEPNEAAVHAAVKNHLLNCRQGTQSALTKGEVSYTTKKPWRQKGHRTRPRRLCRFSRVETRRRRLRPEAQELQICSQQEDQKARLKSALSAKAADGEIVVIDDLKMDEIKTSAFKSFLNSVAATARLSSSPRSSTRRSLRARAISPVSSPPWPPSSAPMRS